MTTLPEDCLEKLKCNACGYYLSCSPVYLKHNGDNLCGRCTVPHDEERLIIRNNSYETVASAMLFPCKYKTVGCSNQLAWGKVKYHEEGCEYRPYNCPTSDCNWSGLHCTLKQHYEENHVNLLLEHPGNVKPNITKDTEKHCLMTAFGLLFILHLKYVVSSSKLWYCVRFLGNAQFASFFEYILEITTGDSGIIRMKKTVQPTNTDVLNQDCSIEININNMLGMGVISNFDDAVFSISIKLNNNKCMVCNNEMTSSVKLSNEGCFCENCEIVEDMENVLLPVQKLSVVPCTNAKSGCSYQGALQDLPKHEKWFCTKAKGDCDLCKSSYSIGLFEHFKKHAPTIQLVNPSGIYHCNESYNGILIFSDAFFCYRFMFSYLLQKFELWLISDLPKNDIKHVLCKIKLSHPNGGYCVELPLKYNIVSPDYDWKLDFFNDRKNSVIYLTSNKHQTISRTFRLELILTKLPET